MSLIPGFKFETQRERFAEAASLYVRGGPLARTCGAKLRTGRVCTQLAIAGEARCLRHGGPAAARRFRERQRAGLQQGSVSPDEWARAEAKRARNALRWAWRKDPRVPGRTIDLGPDDATFVASATLLGVDVDGLYPALADWLRWRWLRHQKDRPDVGRWLEAVRQGLPRQRAAADAALAWTNLGITDKRTLLARAVAPAMRAGDAGTAKTIVEAWRAKSAAIVTPDLDGVGVAPTRPLTSLPVRPWTPRPADAARKRRLPDRVKARVVPSGTPKPLGRPRRMPDSADELLALGEVLRAAGPQVRAMYDAIPREEDRVRFLSDLRAYANAPGDAGALRRWSVWARTVG